MKVRFPCYNTSFPCACTVQEATKRISETVACQHNNLKVIEAYYSDVQKIVLSASTNGYVYYNSFMPIANIEIRELDGRTQVSILFELKKSTKVLMTLFSALVLIFEISLLVLWVMNQLAIFALLCFPLGMLILSYALSTVGLFFSSKGVLRILFVALTREDTKCVPSIYKSKHIE